MSWIFTVTRFLFKHQESTSYFVIRILGYSFTLVGGVIGIFFLFQSLVPLIGYLEAGALFSFLFIGGGLLMIFLSHQKQTRPIDQIMGEAHEIYKQINIEKVLKKNALQILMFSFVAGIILAQFKGQKKILSFKDLSKLSRWLMK
jgi:hypothetical protein